MLEMSRPAHCQGLDVASAQRAIRACCRARALGAPSCATRFEHVGEHVGDQDCLRWKNAARMRRNSADRRDRGGLMMCAASAIDDTRAPT